MGNKRVVLVGISGPSSSGKSTLARLLRTIIPNSFILHQDDFYKAEEDIPKDDETGYTNWDCAGALDMLAFVNAMRYIRQNDGKFPPTLDSKEDQNELGQSGVPDHVVQIMQNEVVAQGLVSHRDTEIVVAFVDGFLLYNDPSVVKELDMSLLVRAPYEKLKARREARSGYVTLEGFWEDPPGYFDNIVWKWYVKDHQHLFENGDVNGALLEDKVPSLQTPTQLDLNMQELLVWAMGSLSNYLENID